MSGVIRTDYVSGQDYKAEDHNAENLAILNAGGHPHMLLKHYEPNSAEGPVCLVGWNKHEMNTVEKNVILGASVSSGVISLPAGDYYIEAQSVSFKTRQTKQKLVKNSDSSTLLIGTSEYIYNRDRSTHLRGFFSLSSSDSIQLELWSEATGSDVVFGYTSSSDDTNENEGYGQISIWKI